jgi:diaminopimelate epimerase
MEILIPGQLRGIAFSKMHVLGNDFVLIETLSQHVNLTAELVKKIADRHTGIGFDQLLWIEPPLQPQGSDVYVRIFNADGSEAVQCGNGLSSVALFLFTQQLVRKTTLQLATKSGVYTAILEPTAEGGAVVRLCISNGELVVTKLVISGFPQPIYTVSVGNPHAVCLVPAPLSSAELLAAGATLSTYAGFPEPVNVSFVTMVHPERVSVQMYERGVGPTLACGSGAVAIFHVLRSLARDQRSAPTTLELAFGLGCLQVSLQATGVYLQSCPQLLYTGTWQSA